MWENRSFAFRLTFTICTLTLFGISGVIFINSLLSRRALENEVRERSMPALVDSIESEITENLIIAHSSLQYLARWGAIAQWMERAEPRDGLHEIAVLCQTFVEVFKTGDINITVNRSAHFYEAVNKEPNAFKKLDPLIDRWFYDFKASGKKIGTNLHAPGDPKYGGKAFVNARVESDNGKFLGVVSAPFDMSPVEQMLKTYKIGKRGRTFIVKNDGTVLMHSNPALSYMNLEDLPGFRDIAEEALQQQTTFFRLMDSEGRPLLVGSRPLEVMETIIFTVADERELMDDIDRARNYSLAATLAMLLVTLLAGLRISLLITRPLQRIIDFAGKVAANAAPEPIAQIGTREMRALAEALNDMNRQLRLSNLSLTSVGRIFDGLDCSLLVTDPETDEILFSNAKVKRDFHIAEDPRGKKCWQVLYSDKTERCPDCGANMLTREPGAVVHRQSYIPASKRLYEETCTLIDWTGDDKAMLVQRTDITEAAEAREALKMRLGQLELALDISQSLFSTEAATTLITRAMAKIGAFMRVGRVRVSRYDEGRGWLNCENEWLNPDYAPPSMLNSSVAFDESHPFYTSYFKEQRPYEAVNDVSQMPGLTYLPAAGIRAFIDAPIYVDGKLWGILGADDCDAPREWTDADSRTLRLVSGMLSALLFRRAADLKLHRMTSLIEEAPLYITYVSRGGDFQYFNSSTAQLLGYEPEELAARGLAAIFSERTLAFVRKTIIPGIVHDGRRTFELPVRRKDGTRRIFSFSGFSIDSGGDMGIGAIGQDITEKKLLEDQVVAAKEAAEKSNKSKSAFLSRMSHEMRTPLNAVMGMANIALGSDKPEKTRDCLQKITGSAKHLLDMINEILDMSNIEADRLELKPREFVFEGLIGKITDHIRPRADDKDQSLSIELDPAIPHAVIGDEQRLGQVIGNLLSNAVKFTEEGGRIELNAALVSETKENCDVAISISDTGVGIPEEKIKSLFTPFEPLDGGVTRKYGGAGLGLAVSQAIVSMMDGTIEVASNKDGGAVFTVTVRLNKVGAGAAQDGTKAVPGGPQTNAITYGNNKAGAAPQSGLKAGTAAATESAGPAAAKAADNIPAPVAGPPAVGGEAGLFSDSRILLAEDVEINREIVLALLEPTGVTIDCAVNGREAVDMFSENPGRYDLIFMDINMPEVNGYEAVSAIRSSGLEGAGEIPIIAMTANAFKEDIDHCLAVGMNGHLAKPIMVEQLMEVLRRHLTP
ncbi:response regulator [Desulfovibrio sp. OttesenSCG-928-G11]|nr:response regulator [Desulfovibrio sp. OttesenSCG-928-G11]